MLDLRLYLLVLLVAGLAAAQPAWSDPDAGTRKQMAIRAFGDHFTLGQSPSNIAWYNDTFTNNSNKWDFHVMYLSTGPAFPGAPSPYDRDPWWLYYSDFTTNIINQLQNNLQRPMLPWFTFYAMAQGYPGLYGNCAGNPPAPVCGGPAQATPWNAHNATYMLQYFRLFKTLMLKLAAFPNVPVVVHVEPDEWGHILLNGTYTWPNLNISTTFVHVGSTGMSELAGFPDNILGWARAFKKLRDTYAGKNVLLIANPSAWDSTGTMTGTRFGNIIKQIAGDWEGAVLETGDREKGAPNLNLNPPYVTAQGVPTVSITGNFDNHVQWITDFHNVTGLPMFVWQAASGNTVFRTCNQVSGHYMDNLVETLLGTYPANKTWVSRYVNAGCYGWMFNAGQGFSTHVDDQLGDGITNPTPAPGNQGQVSVYADDDGGYARLRAQAYYSDPYSLLGIFPGTIPSPTPPPTTPALTPTPPPAANNNNAANTNAATAAASNAATTSEASTTAVTSTALAAGGVTGTTTAAISTTAEAATTAASTTAAATTAAATSAGSSKSSPTLSGGAIGGIVAAIVVVVAIAVAVIVYFFVFKKKEDFVVDA